MLRTKKLIKGMNLCLNFTPMRETNKLLTCVFCYLRNLAVFCLLTLNDYKRVKEEWKEGREEKND